MVFEKNAKILQTKKHNDSNLINLPASVDQSHDCQWFVLCECSFYRSDEKNYLWNIVSFMMCMIEACGVGTPSKIGKIILRLIFAIVFKVNKPLYFNSCH